jgi:hypothetical protein
VFVVADDIVELKLEAAVHIPVHLTKHPSERNRKEAFCPSNYIRGSAEEGRFGCNISMVW